MNARPPLSPELLVLDAAREADRICDWIRANVQDFKRRGAVVALSGGIDSSVVGSLCVRALGKENVFGLLMPEEDSSDDTLRISSGLVAHLGIQHRLENLTPILAAVGCYSRRDEAIRSVVPDYDSSWKHKIVLPGVLDSDSYRVYSLVIETSDGTQRKVRLPLAAYLAIVAATNFKQRTRKMMEYHEADRLNYVATGTPNRLEYDQGFFVKLGDGAADVKPIAHLYKSQVYQMAAYLDVPEEIRKRPPTTDTYSLPQSQEEFYFSLPYDRMDLCLYARDNGYSAAEAASALGLTPEQVERVYRDIEGKRRYARYLHAHPRLVDPSIERG
jgi:NAD+ synthase